jgi:DNA polymerase-3 subunit epsilon
MHMLISDATFVVTDTETTGVSPSEDRVIEIGAVKICGDRVVDRFSSLINPLRSIPGRITRLTGISTGMVFDQPTAEAVLPDFRRFLGDAVFVAHNLSFDWRFINAELDRCNHDVLENESLCTLRLARRVLRGLRSKGLSSLSDYYGIRIDHRHRALDDAEATGIILTRLVSAIAFEHGIDTMEALLGFQRQAYGSRLDDAAHVKQIRSEVLPVMPPRPGVYFMRNRSGKVIYVGKAKNLRARVRTYFTAIEAHPPRTRKLIREVRDVTWKETASELAALLEESRLIKEHQPRHNRALKRFGRRPFIRLDTSSPFPRVEVVQHLVDDGAEYFGPVHGSRNAAGVVDLINTVFRLRECDDATLSRGHSCIYAGMNRCLAPCVSPHVGYAEEVQRVRNFLMGRDDSIFNALEERMKRSAADLEFEQASAYRDWIQMLERMLGQQREVAAPVLDNNAVIIEPSAASEGAQLFFVRFGRYVFNMSLSAKPSREESDRLSEALRTFYNPLQLRPVRYHRQEAEEITILLNWLYARRDVVSIVRWEARLPVKDFAAQVGAAVYARREKGRGAVAVGLSHDDESLCSNF